MTSPSDPAKSVYVETSYAQFQPNSSLRRAMAVAGVLTWPLAVPLALLSRVSPIVFRTSAELVSLFPYFPGVLLRAEFYRFALRRCGRNIVIESGAILLSREIELGDHVLIGRQSILHECTIGSHVLIGERVTVLAGSRQHVLERTDVPMALQGGFKRRTSIGSDCWLGSHAVVMADVSGGSVVAAGAVVAEDVPPYSIVAGVPAKVLRNRKGFPTG